MRILAVLLGGALLAGGALPTRAGEAVTAPEKCPGCWGKIATCLVCKKTARLGTRGDMRWFWCRCGGKLKRTAEFHKNSNQQKIAVCDASPYFGYPKCGHGMGRKTTPAKAKKPADPLSKALADAEAKAAACKARIATLKAELARLEAELKVHEATAKALKKAKAAAPAKPPPGKTPAAKLPADDF